MLNLVEMLWAKALLRLRGKVVRHSRVHPTARVLAGSHVNNSSIGRYSYCGYDCAVLFTDIGGFCSIANSVTFGGAMHPTDYVSTSSAFLEWKDSLKHRFAHHPTPERKRTTIGHDVWIGTGAMVRPGVQVGDGAVIGMGAVVTRDVAPYDIVGGNPARVIRNRFEPEITAALLELAWWDMDDAEIQALAPLFTDPEALLKEQGLL
ncbi:MAG: CatB-related O-acetyltransferase [Pseudomonadota bacterium]